MTSDMYVIGILVAVAILVNAEFRQNQALRIVAKIAASAGFVALAEFHGLSAGSRAQQFVYWGLIAGLIGDVCLLSKQKRWFLIGIGAFLLNHVAYTAACILLGFHEIGMGIAGMALSVLGGRVWRELKPHVGSLAPAVLVYIGVIGIMVACAVGHAVRTQTLGIAASAILFFVSDLFVARERFLESSPWNKAVGLPLYYAAQVGFALSVV